MLWNYYEPFSGSVRCYYKLLFYVNYLELFNMTGKGDKPRSCFSKRFKNNYDEIDWGRTKGKRNRKRNTRRVLGDKPRVRKQQGDCCGNDCEIHRE